MSIIMFGGVALAGCLFLYEKIWDKRQEKKWAWVHEQCKPLFKRNGRINVDDLCDVLDEAERRWRW